MPFRFTHSNQSASVREAHDSEVATTVVMRGFCLRKRRCLSHTVRARCGLGGNDSDDRMCRLDSHRNRSGEVSNRNAALGDSAVHGMHARAEAQQLRFDD